MLTHLDEQELDAKYPLPRWFGLAAPVVRALLRPFRRWLGGSIAGRVGRVERLEAQGAVRDAFELALASAPLCFAPARIPFLPPAGTKQLHDFQWWLFIATAARCARSLGADERRRLIDQLPSAPDPGGVMQARVLEELSRWRWREGDRRGAIDLVRQAVDADPTWPYARVTLAFYAKRSGLEDPLPALIDAVRADPLCLAHIESSFEDSPELIAALRGAVQPS